MLKTDKSHEGAFGYRRNTLGIDVCQEAVERFGGRLPAQRFAWPSIDGVGDGIEFVVLLILAPPFQSWSLQETRRGSAGVMRALRPNRDGASDQASRSDIPAAIRIAVSMKLSANECRRKYRDKGAPAAREAFER